MAENLFITHAQLMRRWSVGKSSLKGLEERGKLTAIRFSTKMVRYTMQQVLALEAEWFAPLSTTAATTAALPKGER